VSAQVRMDSCERSYSYMNAAVGPRLGWHNP